MSDLGKVQIQMQNDVQEFLKPIHKAKTANESVIGRISATEIKNAVPGINLNVPTHNRVYTFERTSNQGMIRAGGDLSLAESTKGILERI